MNYPGVDRTADIEFIKAKNKYEIKKAKKELNLLFDWRDWSTKRDKEISEAYKMISIKQILSFFVYIACILCCFLFFTATQSPLSFIFLGICILFMIYCVIHDMKTESQTKEIEKLTEELYGMN